MGRGLDMRVALLSLTLLTAALVGCIGATDDHEAGLEAASVDLLAPPQADALWADPQHYPHPAYNWPTLTHIPEEAPEWWQPIPHRDHPSTIEGIEHLASTGVARTGDGMAVLGKLAVLPGFGAGLATYDISDPEDPRLISTFQHELSTREVDLIPYPDGRLIALASAVPDQLLLVDLTDPENPREAAVIDLPSQAHTASIVPGTPILYNANSVGDQPAPYDEVLAASTRSQTEIYDLTDPENPTLVKEWDEAPGCHAISFHITDEEQRAYCSAVDVVEIWDIQDPREPETVSQFTMPHTQGPLPAAPSIVTLAHWAIVNEDASILVVADETGWGLAPACDVYVHAEGRTLSGPLGNLWFYDITDETNPILLGWLSPNSAFVDRGPIPEDAFSRICTAHLGQMIPDPGRDLLAMSFYMAGVLIVDFTEPTAPYIVDQWIQDYAMDVHYHQGYLFASGQGLDSLTLR